MIDKKYLPLIEKCHPIIWKYLGDNFPFYGWSILYEPHYENEKFIIAAIHGQIRLNPCVYIFSMFCMEDLEDEDFFIKAFLDPVRTAFLEKGERKMDTGFSPFITHEIITDEKGHKILKKHDKPITETLANP